MKKLTLSMILLCSALISNAQTSNLKCIYAETPVISDQVRQMQNVYLRDVVVSKIKNEKKTYTMLAADNKYLFQKTVDKNNGQNILIGGINSIFIDYEKDSIITEKCVVNKNYVIKDISLTPRWKMVDETKVINGKTCKKAIARGPLKVEAWYAPEIPFGYGPLGYYGLPGLIVELTTPTETYSLRNLEYLLDAPEMKSPAKGLVVTDSEFDKIQNDYFANYGEAKAGEVKIVER